MSRSGTRTAIAAFTITAVTVICLVWWPLTTAIVVLTGSCVWAAL